MIDNNRIKRLGAFLVALSWAVCMICFFVFQSPVQAEAATDDTYWIDVLQYGGLIENGQPSGQTRFITNSQARKFSFNLPQQTAYSYIDMVIFTGGGYPPSDLTFSVEDSGTLSMQFFGPSNAYVRVFGNVTLTWGQSSSVILTVHTSYSGNMWFNVLSMRISQLTPYTDLTANWSIYQDNYTESATFPTYNASDWPGYDEPGNLRIEIPYSKWLPYQHVDLFLLLDVSHIDGITACLVNDQGFIPLSYQYLNNGEQEDSFNMLSISLDLSNVQPAQSNLRIYITFHTEAGSYNNFILYSIHGWSPSSFIDSDGYWFPKLIQAIKDSFSSMYQPPAGATPPAVSDQMQAGQDFVQDGIGQVDQELDVIATIPRPDLGSIDLPSDHLDSIDYNTNVAHLTMLTHSQPFRLIFFFAALFMVVGVVVYGRRG